MPNRTTTGSRIRHTREKLGLTPQRLASRIGVQRCTLESWEKDQLEPRGEAVMRLAGVLQVPMVWLITGDRPHGSRDGGKTPERAQVTQKLDRALAMQKELAAVLNELSADVTRLQKELDDEHELAA